MDDRIGSEVFRFSHEELERVGTGGLEIRKRFKNEGDWELQGRVTASPVSTAVGSLQVTLRGVPAAGAVAPVRVTGPGFSKAVGRSTTLTDLPPGAYTITARTFTTGLPGKPTCRTHTPDLPTHSGRWWRARPPA